MGESGRKNARVFAGKGGRVEGPIADVAGESEVGERGREDGGLFQFGHFEN